MKKKTHTLTWLIGETLLIFTVATISIVLYDMYINIDVDKEMKYETQRVAKEVNAEDTQDISTILENASKSVVRNIKNSYKRYRNI